MITCLIDHADVNLIEERFVWRNFSNDMTSNPEFIIEITDDYLEAYLKRLIKEWAAGMVTFVFNSKYMKVSSFRQHLLQYLLQLKQSEQITLTNTKDERTVDTIYSRTCNMEILLGLPGEYPLIWACKLGYTDMVEWLLQTNVDVNQCRNDGTTGLSLACQEGHTTIVNMLLEKNPNVDLCNRVVRSSLFKACQNGHIDIVKLLLERNPNVNLCDKYGFTPLTQSCLNNDISTVKILLQQKPDINAQSKNGGNALYFSVLRGSLAIVELLLDNNADCNICIYSKGRLTDIFTYRALDSILIEEKYNTYNTLMNNAPLNVQEYIRKKPGHNDRKGSTGYNTMVRYAFGVVAGSSPLHIACFMGRVDIVRCLLDHNADINMTKEDGTTPLSYACEVGHEDIVNILLEKNSKIDPCDNDGFTPLIKACLDNRTSLVKLLIQHKSNINARTFHGANALYFSSFIGNLEITQLLLVNKADCNTSIYSKDRWGDIFTDRVKYSLEIQQKNNTYHTLMNNAPLNVQEYIRKKPGHNDREGSTGYIPMKDYAFGVVAGSSPLQIACFMGRVDIVRCLLDHNADINMAKEDGTTPLSYACEVGHEDIVNILLKKNPNIDPCDSDGFTPLIKACLNNRTSLVQLLIENKPDINARTIDGANALYFSALNGNLEITQLLLVNNADCNICIYSKYRWKDIFTYHVNKPLASKTYDALYMLMNNAPPNVQDYIRKKPGHNDSERSSGYEAMIDYAFEVVAGSSPLQIACFMGRVDIVRCLLDHNADINMTKEDGTTPLSYACEVGHEDIVKILLEKNANIDPCDNDGFTPLIKSCLNNHASTVKLLIKHKPYINARTFAGANALFFSILNGNLEITQLLLENNVDCNICIHSQNSSTDTSAYDAKISLQRIKLDIFYTLMRTASSNVKRYVRSKSLFYETDELDDFHSAGAFYEGHRSRSIEYVFNVVAGSCPLHLACFMGWPDIFRCLLEHRANINLKKEDGTTPLSYACEVGHIDTVKMLLEKNATVDPCDNVGVTPLIKACLNNNTRLVQLLVQHKSAINASTFVGHNALFFSALNGNLEITQLLLENGAYCIICEERIQHEFDNNARKSLVQNQLDIYYNIMTYGLSNVKRNINMKSFGSVDYDKIKSKDYVFNVVAGSSPFHIACFMGWLDVARVLLKHNANIDMTKRWHDTIILCM
ncbi:unnamed protein product [Mytilus edulis]|uniref:Uncharacterized protein n=1 Tax=Mytilus edulis TaxID=6550 RepID=A0A8S3Q0R5_MYTED|nr:unnamed protein product [Mytilus edulis]